MLLILLALIIRGVSFEYRHQRKHPQWAARFDWMIIIGSYAPAFLWGVAFANIVRGVDMDANHNVTANLFKLLNPYGMLGGLPLVLLCLVHGGIFLSLKADGEVRSQAVVVAATPTVLAAATFLIWTVWMRIGSTTPRWPVKFPAPSGCPSPGWLQVPQWQPLHCWPRCC